MSTSRNSRAIGTGAGLLCGLLMGGLSAAWAQQKAVVYKEVCSCSCPPFSVNVRPSTQPPNEGNCKAMSGKVCEDNIDPTKVKKLSCGGQTVVVQTRQARKGVNTPGTLPGTLDPGPRKPSAPFSKPGLKGPILHRGVEGEQQDPSVASPSEPGPESK